MVGSPVTEETNGNELPEQIATSPPIVTIGSAPVIPVNTEVCPAVNVAPVSDMEFEARDAYLIQGLLA